jgi:metal-responsive CopG/Arc/MetJ family transcriptional regulator
MRDVKGERQGVITMIYDHDQRGLLAMLTDIQHEFKGDGIQLRALAERLMYKKVSNR